MVWTTLAARRPHPESHTFCTTFVPFPYRFCSFCFQFEPKRYRLWHKGCFNYTDTLTRDKLDPVRIEWVRNLLMRTMIHHKRIRAIETEFGIKKRQAEVYIVAAREEIRRGNDIDRKERRDEMRLFLNDAIESAKADGDWKALSSLSRELTSLDGLKEPDTVRHEISGAMGLAIETDPVIVAARLEELRKKQGG